MEGLFTDPMVESPEGYRKKGGLVVVGPAGRRFMQQGFTFGLSYGKEDLSTVRTGYTRTMHEIRIALGFKEISWVWFSRHGVTDA